MSTLLRLLLLFLFSANIFATENIQVQALFPGKAMLEINGESKLLSVGQTHAGVTMISATSSHTVLEINGVQKTYTPGSAISVSYQQPQQIREQLMADSQGMYLSDGSINGRTVRLLVDTGATFVAMSANDAKNLGIEFRQHGELTQVTTASGVVPAWRIKLASVKLGLLEQKNIVAVVVEGNYPVVILLGMSFLDRLKVTKENGKMTIEQKIFASSSD